MIFIKHDAEWLRTIKADLLNSGVSINQLRPLKHRERILNQSIRNNFKKQLSWKKH